MAGPASYSRLTKGLKNKMAAFLPLLALHVGVSLSGLPAPAGAATGNGVPLVRVHVVAHSHDDVGFHRNVDQYFEEQVC